VVASIIEVDNAMTITYFNLNGSCSDQWCTGVHNLVLVE